MYDVDETELPPAAIPLPPPTPTSPTLTLLYKRGGSTGMPPALLLGDGWNEGEVRR